MGEIRRKKEVEERGREKVKERVEVKNVREKVNGRWWEKKWNKEG